MTIDLLSIELINVNEYLEKAGIGIKNTQKKEVHKRIKDALCS